MQARTECIRLRIKAQGLTLFAQVVESHGESKLLAMKADETPDPRNRRVEILLP